MQKILLIVLALAASIGAGTYVYSKWKNVPHADEDKELTPSAGEKAEHKASGHEKETAGEKTELMPPPDTAEAPAEKPKKAKAASGHFEMSTPSATHDEMDASDNPGYGKAREKRLADIFKLDKDLAHAVQVKSIHCRVDTCVIEAESKDGDADRFQSLMFALTKQYPWLGNKVDVTTPPENPKTARFVYFHETPK